MHTFGEFPDMHFCYGAADGNCTKAQGIYTEKYPNRTIPSAKIFCRINQRLWDTGTLKSAESSGRIQYSDSNGGDKILYRVQENSGRKNLCKQSQNIQSNSNFPVRILFTDEAKFNKCGTINTRNEHFWARENSQALRDGSYKTVHHHIVPTQCKIT